MKKIKYLVLLLFVILLTGCSGTYNITINDDLSVEEEAVLLLKSDGDAYNRIQELFESNNISRDKYTIEQLTDDIKVTYKEKYIDMDSYLVSSVLYNELFDELDYRTKNNVVDIYTRAKINNKSVDNLKNIVDYYNIDNIDINIKTDIDNNNNADKVENNILSWNINKDTSIKSISLSLKLPIKSYNYYALILPIVIIIALVVMIIIYSRYKKNNPYL